MNFIEPCIDQLLEKINPKYHKPLYTVGDKGYTSKEIKLKLKQSDVILIYPNKKNAKNKKKNYKHKEKLKKRFKVEVSYAYTKKRYKRVKNPVDKKILNYNVFYMLSIIMDVLIYLSNERKYSDFNRSILKSIKGQINYSEYDPYIHIRY